MQLCIEGYRSAGVLQSRSTQAEAQFSQNGRIRLEKFRRSGTFFFCLLPGSRTFISMTNVLIRCSVVIDPQPKCCMISGKIAVNLRLEILVKEAAQCVECNLLLQISLFGSYV